MNRYPKREPQRDHQVEVHEEIVREDGPRGIDRHERVEVVRGNGLEQREEIVEDRGAARSFAMSQMTNLLLLALALLTGLLLLRFGLKLIDANPAAPFVALVYNLSDVFLWPFFGMLENPVVPGGVLIEVTTIFGIVVYLALALLAIKIIDMLTTPGPRPSRQVRVRRHQRQ